MISTASKIDKRSGSMTPSELPLAASVTFNRTSTLSGNTRWIVPEITAPAEDSSAPLSRSCSHILSGNGKVAVGRNERFRKTRIRFDVWLLVDDTLPCKARHLGRLSSSESGGQLQTRHAYFGGVNRNSYPVASNSMEQRCPSAPDCYNHQSRPPVNGGKDDGRRQAPRRR